MFRYEIGQGTELRLLEERQGTELRLLEERHAAELFALTDNSREFLRPWTPWLDDTRTEADSKSFILHSLGQFARGEGLVTGIWHEGRLVGVISFDHINHANRSAMIGYWIGAEYQRRGFVTRSCEALIDYGFSELGLNRIVIWAATDNERSIAIPKNLGFTFEGVERQAQSLNDRFVDTVVYSMLRSEWKLRSYRTP
jgi:ribosomal-protein-serine acetyltransferase